MKKVIFFTLPFFLIAAVELFLPENYFSPTVWGSVSVYNRTGRILLPGPFYPNIDIKANEPGDLGMHTKYSKFKDVHWITNSDGYRTKLTPDKKYDIVIIGDSMAVGSGVNQEDTPAEVLSRILGKDVYGMGAILSSDFIFEGNIEKYNPKYLVLIQSERTLTDIDSFSVTHKTTVVSYSRKIIQKIIHFFHFEKLNPVFVLIDRFLKQEIFHNLRAKILYSLDEKKVIKYANMLFLEGDKANNEVSQEKIDITASKIIELNNFLQSKGVVLIFVPAPNKESIYWDYLPNHKMPTFIPKLVKELQSDGVVAINTQEVFLKERNENKKTLYFTDDNHWNKDGISVALGFVANFIK